MAIYSHKDTHSPHTPTHNIVSSHQETRLLSSHLSLAFPTPGVLAFAFGNTGGPYLQSACLRRITSSRSPTPELGPRRFPPRHSPSHIRAGRRIPPRNMDGDGRRLLHILRQRISGHGFLRRRGTICPASRSHMCPTRNIRRRRPGAQLVEHVHWVAGRLGRLWINGGWHGDRPQVHPLGCLLYTSDAADE